MRGPSLLNLTGPCLALALAILAAGCSHECTTDTDCRSEQMCVFSLAEGCAAKGQCQTQAANASCDSNVNYCGCDGTVVVVGCGYSGGDRPIEGAYTGSCGHGGKDAGGPCTSSADCGQSQGCYFPVADRCAALGTCIEDTPGAPNLGCDSTMAYCSCDGGIVRSCGGHVGLANEPISSPVLVGQSCAELLSDAGASRAALPEGGAQSFEPNNADR
jgi:hypothetical protein